MNNILFDQNSLIQLQNFGTGLSYYSQSNCQVTLTEDGYHIYRPPNYNPTDNGNTMYGGLKIVNSKSNGTHIYDETKDNIFNLKQGHTYIILFHIKGQSSNSPSIGWNNNMGWGGGGLMPIPSQVSAKTFFNNFQGQKDCYYKFTINDNIVKTCTSSYGNFVADSDYLSYKDFSFYFQYTNTGSLGTDLYITNLRMYDITDEKDFNISKQGILKTTMPIEINNSNTHILNHSKEIIGNQIYEY